MPLIVLYRKSQRKLHSSPQQSTTITIMKIALILKNAFLWAVLYLLLAISVVYLYFFEGEGSRSADGYSSSWHARRHNDPTEAVIVGILIAFFLTIAGFQFYIHFHQ
jgi:hypothetical protein